MLPLHTQTDVQMGFMLEIIEKQRAPITFSVPTRQTKRERLLAFQMRKLKHI